MAAPTTSTGSGIPYWDPTQANTDYSNVDWGKLMLEQSPQTAFYRQGQILGVPDDQSGFGRWFKQQFPNFQTGYNAATISDPVHTNIQDYARSLGGLDDWYRQYMSLAPSIRGEDAGSRGGGPARWVGR